MKLEIKIGRKRSKQFIKIHFVVFVIYIDLMEIVKYSLLVPDYLLLVMIFS